MAVFVNELEDISEVLETDIDASETPPLCHKHRVHTYGLSIQVEESVPSLSGGSHTLAERNEGSKDEMQKPKGIEILLRGTLEERYIYLVTWSVA